MHGGLDQGGVSKWVSGSPGASFHFRGKFEVLLDSDVLVNSESTAVLYDTSVCSSLTSENFGQNRYSCTASPAYGCYNGIVTLD
jgi:hypothetical protein